MTILQSGPSQDWDALKLGQDMFSSSNATHNQEAHVINQDYEGRVAGTLFLLPFAATSSNFSSNR